MTNPNSQLIETRQHPTKRHFHQLSATIRTGHAESLLSCVLCREWPSSFHIGCTKFQEQPGAFGVVEAYGGILSPVPGYQTMCGRRVFRSPMASGTIPHMSAIH